MWRWLQNVYRLGVKELSSLSSDVVMMVLIGYVFTAAVYSEATAMKTDLDNASIAIVDADKSTLSARIRDALQAPYFREPVQLDRSEIDESLDKARFTFIMEIPPRLQADVVSGRTPEIAIHVDATAVSQAGVGTAYLTQIIARETLAFLKTPEGADVGSVEPVIRALFNQNLDALRFTASMGVINNVTILSIILVGAAVMRERERGTIEHLLVMPVRPSEIAAAKIWANGLVILLAAAFSLHVVVQIALGAEVKGSIELFLLGAAVYLFAVTSLGVLLATLVNSMPQFALLSLPVFVLMFLLSGAFTPFQSMPIWLQSLMYVSPSTHFVRFAQAVLYRDAGFAIVWRDLLALIVLGAVFLSVALSQFKAMLTRQG